MNDLDNKKIGNSEEIVEIHPASIDATDIGENNYLSFNHTHICTYGNEYPAKLGKVGEEYRCNFCEYTFGTVGHLRPIANEYRSLKGEFNESTT